MIDGFIVFDVCYWHHISVYVLFQFRQDNKQILDKYLSYAR